MSKTLFLFLIPTLAAFYYQPKLNNNCKSYSGFFSLYLSNDCYYNPDLDDDILQIIRRHVGVSETHQVQTEDGYILTLFRIPRQNPKGVILLQHAIYFDSKMWVGQYNESVAFFFWRAGYDVWMGNSRGTLYSKKHVTLQPSDKDFWNFSFHEMGYYDHHATTHYIAEKTNQSVVYVGLSLGATSGLVYASTRPQEASSAVKLMVTMAPVTHIYRGTSAARYIVPPFFHLRRMFNFVELETTFLNEDSWFLATTKTMLRLFPCKKCLVYFNSMLAGWTPDEVDPDLINMVIRVFGAEIPLKLSHHFFQLYNSGGNFQMYDYGREGNLVKYGAEKAPLYPLKDIKVPIFLMYGQNDSFTCVKDNEILYGLLPEKSKIYGKMMVEGFSHGDFAVGRHRNQKVYEKIIDVIEKL